MLSGTLGASFLGNLLTHKGTAGEGTIRAGEMASHPFFNTVPSFD